MIDISIGIEQKKTSELSKKEMKFMNSWREREFGDSETKDFKKDYPDSLFFFLKQGSKIFAFGTLIPLEINFLDKNYNILGISNIISVEKGRGYGRMLVYDMIKYLEKEGKTGLGFCPPRVSEFYNECGFNVKKDFIKRFQSNGTKDEEGDGIYYPGTDGFVNKILSTKDIVEINVPFW